MLSEAKHLYRQPLAFLALITPMVTVTPPAPINTPAAVQ